MSETLLNEKELENIVGGGDEETRKGMCLKCGLTITLNDGESKKCPKCGGRLAIT